MKIAIVGSGISGLGAAYFLRPNHDVTIFEASSVPGGHSRTINVPCEEGDVPVDTGFIVFNHRNYPLLTRLFGELGVETAKSRMSFGVSINEGWLEYGTDNLSSLFAQRLNFIRPAFWRMLYDLLKVNNRARLYRDEDESLSLGDFLQRLGLSQWYKDYFLLAMGGAIWSTPLGSMLDFPARTFIRFFENHGLFSISDQPQWHTVKGGSRRYVERILHPMQNRLRLNCGIQSIIRHEEKVELVDVNGFRHEADQVILASHPDQSLKMIEQPTSEEKNLLGAFTYQPNEMILHDDVSFMPRNKKAWSSWVYLSEKQKDQQPAVSLSYWMNNLQPLETKKNIFITLNPGHEPEPGSVYDRHCFEHPVFDKAAISAQSKLNTIQGKHRLWFCGAWQRYGFHEDGLLSALNVARHFDMDPSWSMTH